MNLLAIFRPSLEKQIERAHKRVKESHGDPSPRINAARKLREIGTPEAIRALLDRFTITASPSRQDETEKEEVLSWLVEFGPRAVGPIRQFLLTQRELYWPLRALKQILPESEWAAQTNEILRSHCEKPPSSSEPTAQIIRFLEGTTSAELSQTIKLFLQDPDDDVCIAAVDYLLHRPEEESREAVLRCYLESEDRPRVRNFILELFAEKGWTVRGFRPRIEETLPPGYLLTRDGTIKKVGRA
ncbi:MAG: hypothetical protein HY645_08630 [Acidobacteria bacterium]|nr:hypothetical protein [Acidobacteriota bacterium]